jgi:UDP-N-acetylglucosamine 2-epimerase (non-hydrolysing)
VIFPIHPRTRKRLAEFGLLDLIKEHPGIRITEPLSYVEFTNLVSRCTIAITDSGGLQEETTYLGIPCATLRENTERPITISQGTNRLLKPHELRGAAREALEGQWPKGSRPDRWDGRAADRAVQSLRRRIVAS